MAEASRAHGRDGRGARPGRRGGRAPLREHRATCGPRTTTAPASSWSRAREERRGRRREKAAQAAGREGRAAERVRRRSTARSSRTPAAAPGARRSTRCTSASSKTRFMSTVSAGSRRVRSHGPSLLDQLTAPVKFTQAVQAPRVATASKTFVEIGLRRRAGRAREAHRQGRSRRSRSERRRASRSGGGEPVPDRELEGRVALVTGGSRGIGARGLRSSWPAPAREVGVNYASERRRGRGASWAAIREAGGDAVALQDDVADPEQARPAWSSRSRRRSAPIADRRAQRRHHPRQPHHEARRGGLATRDRHEPRRRLLHVPRGRAGRC